MNTYEVITTITSALAIILPTVVLTCHKLGYEVPFLSKLSDIFANKTNVYKRRMNKGQW